MFHLADELQQIDQVDPLKGIVDLDDYGANLYEQKAYRNYFPRSLYYYKLQKN